MAKSFKVEVVTPDATAMAAEATSLQVPSWEGYLGVLAGHAPLLCALKAGVVTVTVDDRKRFFAVSGGFMEVADDRAKILADDFIEAPRLRRADLERALEQAREPVAEARGDSPAERQVLREVLEAERAQKLAWVEARLKALEHHEEVAGG